VDENGIVSTIFKNCYIIADGMGGHNGGDVASAKSIEFFLDYLKENAPRASEEHASYIDTMNNAFSYSNSMVYAMAQTDPSLYGMGTTFSCCTIAENNIYITHVGDSRIYLLRNDELNVISKDHSLVQDLIDNGQITKEEGKRHPQHHIITRVLGTNESVEPFNDVIEIKNGDIILLCSDGLTDMVDDEMLIEICKFGKNPEEMVKEMISEANENGGKDNISAIVISVEDEPK
jgi:protein phosphatase